MAYIYLAIGILSEIIGTAFLKASNGFTKVLPAIGGLAGFGMALYFLSLAFKSIPLSVAYATWCGVGIAGASLLGLLIWKEKMSVVGVIGIILIVIGIALVNLPSSEAKTEVDGEIGVHRVD
ncbi:DMT family transporter [Caldalkalibacillus salinus]|uniref:DMT family transporter n=1 Tax=Caldalkalibacillus salinus TaxID=2803787 RepID=UPI001923470B|nr:multidrug efflux SMR transporter [Caldalkalibacillus salinus]